MTKLFQSRWLDIGLLFLRVILTEQAWSIKVLLCGFQGNFSCGTRQVVPSGQHSSIFPPGQPTTAQDLIHLAGSRSWPYNSKPSWSRSWWKPQMYYNLRVMSTKFADIWRWRNVVYYFRLLLVLKMFHRVLLVSRLNCDLECYTFIKREKSEHQRKTLVARREKAHQTQPSYEPRVQNSNGGRLAPSWIYIRGTDSSYAWLHIQLHTSDAATGWRYKGNNLNTNKLGDCNQKLRILHLSQPFPLRL